MADGFINGRGRVWFAIKNATSKASSPAYAAVAYFGADAPDWLPLQLGSRLVVDASDVVVKSGQTCPASLKEMTRRGVSVYSRPGLHAKVFVIGSTAFIGSANVSSHSARHLIEAVAVIKQRKIVASARQFVRDHCIRLLGPKELQRLSKIYRKPKWQVRAQGDDASVDRDLRIVRLVLYDPSETMDVARKRGRKIARKLMKEKTTTHRIEDFDWSRPSTFYRKQWVLRITKDGDGRITVSPPARIIHLRKVRDAGRQKTIVFVEVAKRRALGLEALTKKLVEVRKLSWKRAECCAMTS